MNQERWRLIEHLFHTARELRFDERPAFLVHACAGDAELRDEVGSLLRESEDAGEFLAESALSISLALLACGRSAASDELD